MDLGLYRGEQYTPRYDVNNSTSHSAHKNDITNFYRKSDEARTFQADFLLSYKKMITIIVLMQQWDIRHEKLLVKASTPK